MTNCAHKIVVRYNKILIPTMAVTVLNGSAVSALGQPSIRPVEHLPSQSDTTARDISNRGAVAAAFGRTPDNTHRAIRSMADAGSLELEVIPNSSDSLAYTISDYGTTIAGYCQINSRQIATIWNADGSLVSIGEQLGPTAKSVFYAMSPDGTYLTGSWTDPDLGTGGMFRWSNELGFELVTPTIGSGIGKGISSDGMSIIYTASVQGHQRPFLWNDTAGSIALGVLTGGNFGYAEGISDDGRTVVGGSGFAIAGQSDWQSPFLWTADNGMIDLGRLESNHDIAVAYSCNRNGTLIGGTSGIDESRTFDAFLWTREHGMLNLRDHLTSQGVDVSGWEFESVIAVSGDGSSAAGSGVYNGQPNGLGRKRSQSRPSLHRRHKPRRRPLPNRLHRLGRRFQQPTPRMRPEQRRLMHTHRLYSMGRKLQRRLRLVLTDCARDARGICQYPGVAFGCRPLFNVLVSPDHHA